jgi:hypothetical protein
MARVVLEGSALTWETILFPQLETLVFGWRLRVRVGPGGGVEPLRLGHRRNQTQGQRAAHELAAVSLQW